MGRLCRSRATGLQSPQVTIPDAGHNATSRSRRELQPALHGAVAQADQRNFMLIEIAIGLGLEIGEAVSAAKIMMFTTVRTQVGLGGRELGRATCRERVGEEG